MQGVKKIKVTVYMEKGDEFEPQYMDATNKDLFLEECAKFYDDLEEFTSEQFGEE